MCICLCVYVHEFICSWWSEERIECLRAEVTSNGESPSGAREPNAGLLYEQYMLLNAKPSLQSLC